MVVVVGICWDGEGGVDDLVEFVVCVGFDVFVEVGVGKFV